MIRLPMKAKLVFECDVKLVVSQLASKTAGDVQFQVADVSALVYQVRRLDAYRPLKRSATQ